MTDRLVEWLEATLEEEYAKRARRRTARQAQLERNVAAFLGAHQDATANEVARQVAGRRHEVLRTVRDVRRDNGRYPSGGNQ